MKYFDFYSLKALLKAILLQIANSLQNESFGHTK